MDDITKRLDRIEDKLDRALDSHNEFKLETCLDISEIKTKSKTLAKVYSMVGSAVAVAVSVFIAIWKS